MTTADRDDGPALNVLRGLMECLAGGAATSIYKPLLVLSLVDAVALMERETTFVPLHALGDRAARILWPAAAPYQGAELQAQLAAGKASMLRLVAEAQKFEPRSARFFHGPLHRSTRERLAQDLGWILGQWPLPRLQALQGVDQEFLYRVPDEWREHIRGPRHNQPLPKRMLMKNAAGDPGVSLLPGVATVLDELAVLIRPAAELRLTSLVAEATWPRGDGSPLGLWSHLFPPPLRSGMATSARRYLRRVDGEQCTWCRGQLPQDVAVDHVVPWSRTHNDAVDNLALSHVGCNSVKSDHLPSPDLTTRFHKGLARRDSQSGARADEAGLTFDRVGCLTELHLAVSKVTPDTLIFDVDALGKPCLRVLGDDRY